MEKHIQRQLQLNKLLVSQHNKTNGYQESGGWLQPVQIHGRRHDSISVNSI